MKIILQIRPLNNERAITAIKHYDQSMQSSDAGFHWSLLVKSYHPSDTSIYHWAPTVVIIKMTGMALFQQFWVIIHAWKWGVRKSLFISAILMDFIFFVFPLDYICSDSVLVPFLCFCTRMQSSVWGEFRERSERQSNFQKLTNNQVIIKSFKVLSN